MASYKSCVEKFCKECVYDPLEPGSWRKQVTECGHFNCPLWDVRPKTMARIELERGKGKKAAPIKVKTID